MVKFSKKSSKNAKNYALLALLALGRTVSLKSVITIDKNWSIS